MASLDPLINLFTQIQGMKAGLMGRQLQAFLSAQYQYTLCCQAIVKQVVNALL
jgi:hypothetical protein